MDDDRCILAASISQRFFEAEKNVSGQPVFLYLLRHSGGRTTPIGLSGQRGIPAAAALANAEEKAGLI